MQILIMSLLHLCYVTLSYVSSAAFFISILPYLFFSVFLKFKAGHLFQKEIHYAPRGGRRAWVEAHCAVRSRIGRPKAVICNQMRAIMTVSEEKACNDQMGFSRALDASKKEGSE